MKNKKLLTLSVVVIAIVSIAAINYALKTKTKNSINGSINQEIINNALLSKKTVDELTKIYDPKLSVQQGKYRIWLAQCNETTAQMLSVETFKNYEILNKNINFLLSAQDTVRKNILYFNYTLAEYGVLIKDLIPNDKAKSEFERKWKLYMEGMSEVFNYDLEYFNNLAKFFKFLKDNHLKYEVNNDRIFFETDEQINSYNDFLLLLDNEDNLIKQQEIRSTCVHIFLEAISFAQIESQKEKENADKVVL